MLHLFQSSHRFGVVEHVVVGLLVLIDVHCFEISVGEKASANRFEARVGCWEENACNVYNIARIDLPGNSAVAMDGQCPGDVSYRDLIGHLLYLDLLERQEFGSPSRQKQRSL